MSYPQQYGPAGYVPVSSKSGILVAALLSTLAVGIMAVGMFVLPFLEDPMESYTYQGFAAETDNLTTDLIIMSVSAAVALVCAWLIYAAPATVMSTILRIIFVIAGLVAGGFAVITMFLAEGSHGLTLNEVVEETAIEWGFGAWTMLGGGIFIFLMSIVMIFVVSSYKRSLRRVGGYGQPYGQPTPYQPGY